MLIIYNILIIKYIITIKCYFQIKYKIYWNILIICIMIIIYLTWKDFFVKTRESCDLPTELSPNKTTFNMILCIVDNLYSNI